MFCQQIRPSFLVSLCNFSRLGSQFMRMSYSSADFELKQNAKSIFLHALRSVYPAPLISKILRRDGDVMWVENKKYQLKNNVFLVGFGKAVLPMGCHVTRVLRDHVQRGVLSVPTGSRALLSCSDSELLSSLNVEVKEGARSNLPDEAALEAACTIRELTAALDSQHILLVLISGGGSALLPLPKPPITLSEKSELIRALSQSGASILELNCVRKKISAVKGGELARLASPASTISLVLSDVIGDPLDAIASGPTTYNMDSPDAALKVLHKYHLWSHTPASIQQILIDQKSEIKENCDFPTVHNVLIGNNMMALKSAAEHAKSLGYFPIILSDSVEGNVMEVSSFYTQLIQSSILCLQGENISIHDTSSNIISTDILNTLEKDLKEAAATSSSRGVCLIAGGEPTVVVTGQGLGGRNQELALRVGQGLQDTSGYSTCFLSAGTDGIDGPTEAAGAVVTSHLRNDAENVEINLQKYLDYNDSFNCLLKLKQDNLIITGHTGTNVSDVHVILLQHKKSC